MYTYKDVDINLGFDINIKKRVRFSGINAPESRTRDLEEKARGLAAKDRVKAILNENETFVLNSKEIGKFGRVLGEIFIDTVDGQDKLTMVSLNELLKTEGHAVEYHGGKR